MRQRPNIVVIGVDTLRPDHLGCYGYDRPTSPGLDALAEHSVVFDNAFAAGIPTTPAFTTMLTGLHPYVHRVVTHPAQRRLAGDVRTLAQLAQAAGYTTAACDNLVVQGSGSGSWFARGYDHYSGFVYTPFGDQSARLTDTALSLAAEPRDGPLLLLLHYWDPHTPYGPLPPYDEMHYQPGAGPVDMAQVRAIAPEYYDAFVGDMNLAHPEDYAYILAQYDGEISQVDAQIQRLVEVLERLDPHRETVIVVVSDHGECFGEGDFYFDHHGLYDAVTRTVLLLRVPGITPGRRDGLVTHEDLLPTLCELGGIALPDYELTGTSLVPMLSSPLDGRDHVVSCEATRQASLAVRTPAYKLIQPITVDAAGQPLPDFYGRPRSAKPLLFDLGADPAEHVDVAAEQPEVLAELSDHLARWRQNMAERTSEPDPIQAQGLGLPYDRFLERVLRRHPSGIRRDR